MPRAARWCGGSCVTSSPNSLIRPPVAGSSPLITLNSVVLPAPFGPMSACRSPGCTRQVDLVDRLEAAEVPRDVSSLSARAHGS